MKPPLNTPARALLCDEGSTLKPLRFVGILRQELEKLEGNKNALKTAINRASEAAGSRCTITYDKLSKLLDNDGGVGLTQQDLIALHFFLKPLGEGLDEKPIFDKAGILSRLVECGRLSVFFGAYPHVEAHRNDVSLWDNRALAVLVKEVGNLNRRVQISTQDVLWTNDRARLCEDVQSTVDRLDHENSSIISIGTPRACMASEVLLSKAFNVAPRATPTAKRQWNSPFAFVWPPELGDGIESSFAMTGEDLIRLGFAAEGHRVKKGECSALKVGDKVYETELQSTKFSWTMYGVIVAQCRARGGVWLVISGISGPATQACAEQVAAMATNLPFVAGRDGPVLWAVVRAEVSVDQSGRTLGDKRTVSSSELLEEPYVWHEQRSNSLH